MATMKTRPILREELAKFLPNQRLVRAFENMTEDVGETIPGAIDEIASLLEDESLGSSAARAEAAAAMAMAVATRMLVDVLASAPSQAPHVTPLVLGPDSQIAALREEVARLATRLRALELNPA